MRQGAVLLEHQKPPCQLDHAAPDSRVTGSSQPFLATLLAALVGRAGEAPIARHRPTVAQVSRQHLLHQHVGCLDANPDHARQQAHHGVWSIAGGFLETLQASILDVPDLTANEPTALHIATQLSQRVGRDCDHLAVITFAAEPTEKGAFEQLGVETVGLGAPVFTRYCYTRCVDNVGFDAACSEPARQPETIPAGLEGNCNAFDLPSRFLRFLTPAIEKLQQCALVDRELLQWLALDARHDAGNEPA